MVTAVKRLPLHDLHVKAGGHMGAFGDWEVPLYFTSILDEHDAVRNRAGVFDISHMGEFFVRGKEARVFLDQILPRKMSRLENSKALYAPLLNEEGGIVDDLIVYQMDPQNFLLIVNAANIDKDFAWIKSHLIPGVELENVSDEKFLFALQGPKSLEIAETLFGRKLKGIRYYHFLTLNTEWGELFLSRTGYTGEDGFEIMADTSKAEPVWKALFEVGKKFGLLPIGFGARDTLRLEAGMALYGHDMDDSTSAVEASLDWAVDFDKTNFVGRQRNIREKEKGAPKKLVGIEMIERGIPRQACEIQKQGCVVGHITSGTFSPTLKKNIALGYVTTAESQLGNEIDVVIRNQKVKARIVKFPFYKCPSKNA